MMTSKNFDQIKIQANKLGKNKTLWNRQNVTKSDYKFSYTDKKISVQIHLMD